MSSASRPPRARSKFLKAKEFNDVYLHGQYPSRSDSPSATPTTLVPRLKLGNDKRRRELQAQQEAASHGTTAAEVYLSDLIAREKFKAEKRQKQSDASSVASRGGSRAARAPSTHRSAGRRSSAIDRLRGQVSAARSRSAAASHAGTAVAAATTSAAPGVSTVVGGASYVFDGDESHATVAALRRRLQEKGAEVQSLHKALQRTEVLLRSRQERPRAASARHHTPSRTASPRETAANGGANDHAEKTDDPEWLRRRVNFLEGQLTRSMLEIESLKRDTRGNRLRQLEIELEAAEAELRRLRLTTKGGRGGVVHTAQHRRRDPSAGLAGFARTNSGGSASSSSASSRRGRRQSNRTPSPSSGRRSSASSSPGRGATALLEAKNAQLERLAQELSDMRARHAAANEGTLVARAALEQLHHEHAVAVQELQALRQLPQEVARLQRVVEERQGTIIRLDRQLEAAQQRLSLVQDGASAAAAAPRDELHALRQLVREKTQQEAALRDTVSRTRAETAAAVEEHYKTLLSNESNLARDREERQAQTIAELRAANEHLRTESERHRADLTQQLEELRAQLKQNATERLVLSKTLEAMTHQNAMHEETERRLLDDLRSATAAAAASAAEAAAARSAQPAPVERGQGSTGHAKSEPPTSPEEDGAYTPLSSVRESSTPPSAPTPALSTDNAAPPAVDAPPKEEKEAPAASSHPPPSLPPSSASSTTSSTSSVTPSSVSSARESSAKSEPADPAQEDEAAATLASSAPEESVVGGADDEQIASSRRSSASSRKSHSGSLHETKSSSSRASSAASHHTEGEAGVPEGEVAVDASSSDRESPHLPEDVGAGTEDSSKSSVSDTSTDITDSSNDSSGGGDDESASLQLSDEKVAAEVGLGATEGAAPGSRSPQIDEKAESIGSTSSYLSYFPAPPAIMPKPVSILVSGSTALRSPRFRGDSPRAVVIAPPETPPASLSASSAASTTSSPELSSSSSSGSGNNAGGSAHDNAHASEERKEEEQEKEAAAAAVGPTTPEPPASHSSEQVVPKLALPTPIGSGRLPSPSVPELSSQEYKPMKPPQQRRGSDTRSGADPTLYEITFTDSNAFITKLKEMHKSPSARRAPPPPLFSTEQTLRSVVVKSPSFRKSTPSPVGRSPPRLPRPQSSAAPRYGNGEGFPTPKSSEGEISQPTVVTPASPPLPQASAPPPPPSSSSSSPASSTTSDGSGDETTTGADDHIQDDNPAQHDTTGAPADLASPAEDKQNSADDRDEAQAELQIPSDGQDGLETAVQEDKPSSSSDVADGANGAASPTTGAAAAQVSVLSSMQPDDDDTSTSSQSSRASSGKASPVPEQEEREEGNNTVDHSEGEAQKIVNTQTAAVSEKDGTDGEDDDTPRIPENLPPLPPPPTRAAGSADVWPPPPPTVVVPAPPPQATTETHIPEDDKIDSSAAAAELDATPVPTAPSPEASEEDKPTSAEQEENNVETERGDDAKSDASEEKRRSGQGENNDVNKDVNHASSADHSGTDNGDGDEDEDTTVFGRGGVPPLPVALPPPAPVDTDASETPQFVPPPPLPVVVTPPVPTLDSAPFVAPPPIPMVAQPPNTAAVDATAPPPPAPPSDPSAEAPQLQPQTPSEKEEGGREKSSEEKSSSAATPSAPPLPLVSYEDIVSSPAPVHTPKEQEETEQSTSMTASNEDENGGDHNVINDKSNRNSASDSRSSSNDDNSAPAPISAPEAVEKAEEVPRPSEAATAVPVTTAVVRETSADSGSSGSIVIMPPPAFLHEAAADPHAESSSSSSSASEAGDKKLPVTLDAALDGSATVSDGAEAADADTVNVTPPAALAEAIHNNINDDDDDDEFPELPDP